MRLSKLIFILGILFSHSLIAGEILFVNMNESNKEIIAAKKAAKEKGDTLIVIPKEGAIYNHEEFKQLVKEKSFKSLIISGHSGGDVFEGGSGVERNKVKIEDLLSALDDSKTNDLESLYLMGCYTTNKSKIAFWKNALPNLKFIAGFEQEAPLSTKPASQQYLYNLMKKEDSIIGTKNNQDLKLLLSGIDVLKIVNASLYIRCEDEDYNYVSQLPKDKKFSKIDASACSELVGEFRKNYLADVRKYQKGEAEPTALNTKDSVLRKAYTLARKAEYCRDVDSETLIPELEPNSLFFLLFNKGFNETFARYYKDDIENAILDAEAALSSSEEYQKRALAQFQNRDKTIDQFLQTPDLDNLINQEIAAMKKEMEELDKKNPGLDNCVMWNRECHFPDSLIRKYGGLWGTAENRLRRVKVPSEFYKKDLKERLGLYVMPTAISPPVTNENLAIMRKMISSPGEVTRKDIVTLEKSLRSPENLSPALEKFRNAIGAAYKLSPNFPFSWHEYTGGEIERPGSESAHFKNPALKDLNEFFLVDEYYADDEED